MLLLTSFCLSFSWATCIASRALLVARLPAHDAVIGLNETYSITWELSVRILRLGETRVLVRGIARLLLGRVHIFDLLHLLFSLVDPLLTEVALSIDTLGVLN